MRRTRLIILIGLISSIVYGQSFETNLTLSPLMTFKSNQTTESKLAFGFSGSIQEFYNLTDNFAIGSEIRYSFENYKFKNYNLKTGDFPDYFVVGAPVYYYENKLTVHSFNMPLILRIKTKSDWSLSFGYGLTYNINYKVSVNHIYYNLLLSKDTTRTEIRDKSVDLKNDLTSFVLIGIGKAFKIRDLRLLAEVYYNYCFADYRIEHSGRNKEILYFYNINPQYIGFKIGFGI